MTHQWSTCTHCRFPKRKRTRCAVCDLRNESTTLFLKARVLKGLHNDLKADLDKNPKDHDHNHTHAVLDALETARRTMRRSATAYGETAERIGETLTTNHA